MGFAGLTGLRLDNIALIERLELAFDHGFSVLTGETGAGKSLLLDALDALLGGMQGTSASRLVRTGCDRAVIEATFTPDHAVRRWLQEHQLDDDGGDFEDDYRDFRPVSRFQSDDFGDDYSYDDYDGDEGVDSGSTSTSGTKEEMQMDAAEQWLGEHHNKFFKNVVKELSMDEDGWERAAKKQFSMRKEIIKDAANMRKMEGYRSMLVLALEVATAIGALVSFKNWVESDIYMRDVIDLRQIVPKIPDKSNLLPVRERPTRPSAELVKKDISKLTTEELKAQLALLREQKS